MKRVFLINTLLLFALIVNGQQSETSLTEKQKDIQKYLDLNGSAESGKATLIRLIDVYQKNQPNIPIEFWNDFKKELDFSVVIKKMVPIYDKYFTHQEIKQLISFYQSPIGKKLVSTKENISKDSQIIAQEYGIYIMNRLALWEKNKGLKK